MTSNKRAKDLARAKSDRQADRRADREKRQRMINRIVAVVAVVVIAGGGVGGLICGAGGGQPEIPVLGRFADFSAIYRCVI